MAGLLTWSAVDHLPAETACTRIGSGSKIEHGLGSGARVDLPLLPASPHSYGDSSGLAPVFPFNAVTGNGKLQP
jgi:hypothetical protein